MNHTEILGWVATTVFVASYFFAKPAALRAVQMVGACLWIVYGVLIGALPVIAANALVFTAAAWTFARSRWTRPAAATSQAPHPAS
jgi:hypothetical protein